jgi:hypothetical protein
MRGRPLEYLGNRTKRISGALPHSQISLGKKDGRACGYTGPDHGLDQASTTNHNDINGDRRTLYPPHDRKRGDYGVNGGGWGLFGGQKTPTSIPLLVIAVATDLWNVLRLFFGSVENSLIKTMVTGYGSGYVTVTGSTGYGLRYVRPPYKRL